MAKKWKTIRIFISSTFRDMHAERNHLVRFVFPELKERCRKQHIHLIDVDLRWGVSEADAQDGKALDICLDEVDSCRPYFLGLLGHCYGWVPRGQEHSITAQEIYHGVLHNDLPSHVVDLRRIVEGKLEGKSLSTEQIKCLVGCYQWDAEKGKHLLSDNVSEDEIKVIRSVFRNYSAYQRDRSFFFFRSKALTKKLARYNIEDFFESEEMGKEKLVALKQEITDSGLPCFEYDNIEAFGNNVRNILWKRIEAELGEIVEIEKDWLKEEAEFHELFVTDRTRRFVGRRNLLDSMRAFCENDGDSTVMVITGEPGCGKSALMGRFTEDIVHNHPDWLIVPHFVGASPTSTNLRQTLRHLCAQIYKSCDFEMQKQQLLSQKKGNDESVQKERETILKEYSIPEEYKELKITFNDFLKKAVVSHKTIIILDAVNQFEKTDNAHDMRWLPHKLPENVRFIVSTLAGEVPEALLSRRIKPLVKEVTGLDDVEIKELVNAYLKEIRHEFPNKGVEQIFYEKVKPGNPLYIQAALEELRVFGQFEELAVRVNELPDNVPALFDQVLERIEADFEPDLVRYCMIFISCGKHGMTAEELQTLLRAHAPRIDSETELEKLPDMMWARLYRAFSSYLFERSGVIDFFHRQLKEAVGERYLCKEADRVAAHKYIAAYFEDRWQEPYLRALAELPHQYLKGEDSEKLKEVVSGPFFEVKAELQGVENCLTDLQDIARFFAGGGKNHWESLATCAKNYCNLIEDFRGTSRGLEALIAAGQIKRVREIVDNEIGEANRGLLMVGVSILLADAGYVDAAEEIRKEALPIIRMVSYSAPGDCLLHAVLSTVEYPWPPHKKCEYFYPVQPIVPRKACSYDDLPKSNPRKTVPLKYLIASYLSGVMAWFGVIGWLLISFTLIIIIFDKFLIWPFVLCVVFFLFMGMITLHFSPEFIKSHWWEISKIEAGLARAFGESDESHRFLILDRILRFLKIRYDGFPSFEKEVTNVHLEPIVKQYLESDAKPEAIADFIITIASRDESLMQIVAMEFLHCDHRKLNSILKELVISSMDIKTQWVILRLVMSTFKRKKSPDYLAGFIPINLFPRSGKTFLELWERQKLVDSLQKAPEICLGKALVETAWHEGGKKSRSSDTIYDKEFWKRITFIKSITNPLHKWELPVYLIIVGIPFGLGAVPCLMGLLLFALSIISIGMGLAVLAMRVNNPLEIVSLPQKSKEKDRLSEVVEKGIDPSHWYQLDHENRNILRTLAAIRVMEGGSLAGKNADVYSEKFNRSIIKKILHRRLIQGGSEAILHFIGDRKLLDIILSMGPLSKIRNIRKPSDKEQNSQIKRVLPILNKWQSLLLAVSLSMTGIMIWIKSLTKLGPENLVSILDIHRVILLMAFSVFLCIMQHTRRHKTVLSLRNLLLTILILLPVSIFFFTPSELFARQHYSLLLGVLLITNLFVPTFITWWRGGFLFFPSATRLWMNRLLGTLMMISACMVLSALTRILFIALSLLHLKVRWF